MIRPEGWPRPKGYAHAVVAEGRLVFLAGQIGWDASETLRSDDFVDQARQALENVVTLLRAAGGQPEHLVRMTWYVVDRREYLGRLKDLGQVYREVVGPTFPAMTAVEVSSLIEDRARVEIECTAVIPG
ncbi:MAG TPA: RidA family protein [Geminicoccaceae bacterium]|nr:RidA family protein [Geminicoccaceae bacterium]